MVGLPTMVNVTFCEVPPSVVTVTSSAPGESPSGTTSFISVSLFEINVEVAFVPNSTEEAVFKFLPCKVTVIPTDALVGSIDVISGSLGNTRKDIVFDVAASVFTDTINAPGKRPGGTTVSILTADFDAREDVTLPNEADSAEARFSPVIVIGVPMGPCTGSMDVIAGFGFSGSLHVASPTTSPNSANAVKIVLLIFIAQGIIIKAVIDAHINFSQLLFLSRYFNPD